MSSESYIIHDQYAVHFLTFTVVDWSASGDVFTQANYKIEVAKSLEYCQENKDYLYSSAPNYASIGGVINIETVT